MCVWLLTQEAEKTRDQEQKLTELLNSEAALQERLQQVSFYFNFNHLVCQGQGNR